MEQKDLFNRFREPLGKSVLRSHKLEQGEYSLAVRIWIRSAGLFLIQRRNSDKRRWPDCWDCAAAGCVSAGESTRESAVRELREELGIIVQPEALQWLCTTLSHHRFDDIYLLDCASMPERLCLQAEEVADARPADMAEIRRLLTIGEFVPYEYVEILQGLMNSSLRLVPETGGFQVILNGEPAGVVRVQPLGSGEGVASCRVPQEAVAAVLTRLEQMLPQYTQLRISDGRVDWEKNTGFQWILQERDL